MAFLAKQNQPQKTTVGRVRRVLAHHDSGATMASGSWTSVAPLAGNPPHICKSSEEILFVVAGAVDFTLGNDIRRLKAGDGAIVPVGVNHGYSNNGDITAEIVTFRSAAQPKFDAPAASNDGGQLFLRSANKLLDFFPKVQRYAVAGPGTVARNSNLSDVFIEPGGGIAKHYHPEHEELMVCLEGELTLTYGEDTITAKPGDAILVEIATLHAVANNGETTARMLAYHPLLEPPRVFV